MKQKLERYLKSILAKKGSDLHLKAGSIPHARLNGELIPVKDDPLTQEDMQKIVSLILTETQIDKLEERHEIDTTYSVGEKGRFRVNCFYHTNGLGMVFRAIPNMIPSLTELNLPRVLNDFADLENGLVLVTGVTGSGKSTTLASMIEQINKRKRKHIVTIEEPIEYLFHEKKSLITQRAVGLDTQSFASALHSAFREDIDILLIGELRDLETAEIALNAAQSGHLVFSTLHTLDAKESLNRIISLFPKEKHELVRTTLSFVLKGVVSQRLVKDKDGGLTPAVEVMKNTSRITELISDENRYNELLDAIEQGKGVYGSQSFDQSLLDLYKTGKIAREEALSNATKPSDLNLAIDAVRAATSTPSAENPTENDSSVETFGLK
jgi:twitching motility protein PilT